MLKKALICLFLPLAALSAQTLTVSSHTPTKNAVDVAIGANITVTFNDAVSGATLDDDATFNVDGSQSGEHQGNFSGGGSSEITFDPTNEFEYGETITVTLTTGIQSTGASALAAAYTFQFVAKATAGSGYFYDSSNSLGSSASNSVAMGDIDGDGDIDAVTANESQAQGVWFNNGSGSYSSGTSFGSGASKSIKLGDVDGDGDLDAVIANYNANEEVWLNNGSGNFGASAYDTFGGGASKDVALGDVDGDGDLDAVIANFNAAQQVWLNNGSGDFGISFYDDFGSGMSESIALGDMDGDGDLDAVVVNNLNQANEIWLNDGSGNYGASAYDTFGSSTSNHVALADVNSDNSLDVVVANYGSNTVWLNDGSGGVGVSYDDTFGSGTNTLSMALGDVDQDGDLDAVAGNSNQSQQVWLNNGSGDFGATAINSFDASITKSIALADVDGNGTLDVFSVNENQANTVYLNQLLSSVVSHTPTINKIDVASTSSISITFNNNINAATLDDDATFNVDGSLSGEHQGTFSGGSTSSITFDPTNDFQYGEVITVTLTIGIASTVGAPLEAPYTFQFFVEAEYGWGTFYDSGNILGGYNSQCVSLGDLDGDGDIDAFVGNQGEDIKIWLNDGSANFTDNGQENLSSVDSRDVALGDLDGDGDLDAFVANWVVANTVWTNDGSGTFTNSGQTLGSAASFGVSLGDVDGDGDLDAFVANWGGTNTLYINNGSGTFTDSGLTLGSSNSTSVSLGDLDNDGDLDAYVVNYTQFNSFWRNDGSGNFTNAGNSMGTSNSQDVSLGDMNGDGDLDAFVANNTPANKIWFFDGTWFYDSGQNLSNGNSEAAVMGDLDGDGDLDGFTANVGANKIWLNNGGGTFTDSGPNYGASTSKDAALADLDGDGDLDAFVVNFDLPNIVWLNKGFDHGDLPSDYYVTLLAHSGARHELPTTGQIQLGSIIDHEMDGQESADAGRASSSGDDNTSGSDDEDGVSVVGTTWSEGTNGGSIQVIVTGGSGYLSAWIDWNDDNDLNDAGEQIFNMQAVTAGTQTLSFTIPAGALPNNGTYNRFSRFRLDDSNTSAMTTISSVTNGEVEDHYLQFSRSFDFGDLPAGYNLTETADNGARHELQNTGQIYLGLAIDAELDGQESTDAGRASSSGDDNTSGTDDEDGVLVMGYWHDGTNGGSVQVIVTGSSGYLSGWIDWNDDNDFADTGEQIFNMQAVTAGVNVLSFDIPAGAIPSNGTYNRFGRFRLDDSNTSAMTTTGLVTNGEVEDHYLQFSRNFDFGDLPADYNLTEAVDNGARHELQYTGQIYLGPAIDTELDGQESIDAGRAADSGDDNSSGSDDEDGVSVVDGWLEGTNGGAVEVFVTGGSGYLSAWIDWNDDNDFADTGEQIFNMQAVAEGADTLSFDIPAGGIPTPDTYNRFSRFRLDDSNTVAMTTTGLVTNGEVEDHYLQFTGFNLVVVSHTPAQNTIDVSVSSSLSMTFSKNINAATLNDDITFNVDGSLSGEHQGVFSGGGTSTITFDPTNDFEVGEVVTITLTTGIQSTDATPLDAPYTSQFFVEAPFGSCTFMDSGNNLGSYQSYDISLGDLDGDGDLDAFVANSNNQANKVWKNDGNGIFTDSGQNLGLADSYDVSLGDLDGDGDLDAFVANISTYNKIWLNNGSGIFTDSGQNLSSSGAIGVSLGDLDGDGDLDAFVATMFGQYSKVWLNDGNGIFTDSGQNLGLTNSTCVSLGDLDGDGDLDAFVANHNTYNKVWLNNGSGTFTDSGQNLGLSSNSYGVSLGDLDGDGDLDAFVANYKDKNIVWLNNGSGTFTDNGQTLGNSQSRGVSLGDLDSDGDLDAFVVNFDEANIVWKNAGNGHFTDSGQSLGNSSSTGFSLGDLNGDGDLDAFVANYDQANKVWINYFEARLQAKIFLEGPYDDTANEMSTAINGSIPLTSPYSEDARTVADIPSTITDWVLVELRSTADGSTVRSRSAFLRKDGLIVADDGTTEYITVDAAAGDYFIVIRHRNHLAVMSDEVHALAAGNSTLYNFTTGLDKYYGGEAAVVESGVYGMYAGDPNCSSGVNATDYMTVKIVNGSNGYFSEDCNLSGGVNSTDYMVIKPNSGKTCNVQ